MSGGERKRLALLRAALCRPDVLLVDEPFEGLDEQNIVRVSAFLSRLGKRIPVLVASHITPAEVQVVRAVNIAGRGEETEHDSWQREVERTERALDQIR